MKIINRIKELLNHTVENGCTKEEAASAFAIARKLMIKHKIEEADIKEPIEDDIVKEELSYDCKIFHNISLLKVFLNNFGVMHFMIHKGEELHCVLFGTKIDVDCVKTLMKCAYDYMFNASEQFMLEMAELFGEKDYTVQTSYIRGFISGLNAKYEEQNKSLNKEESLMIIPNKEVKNKFNEFSKNFENEELEFNNEKVNTSEYLAMSAGYREGRQFGTTALVGGYAIE